MEAKIVIKISDIVSNLNEDELFELCDRYGIKTSNFFKTVSKGIYKNNLKKKIIASAGNKESINRATFTKHFVPLLSEETIIKIYPQYKEYIKKIHLFMRF